MQALLIKRGSLWPPFQATIGTNKSGNLTGATAELRLMDSAGTPTATYSLTIVDGAAGTVSYQWIAGDTDNAGTAWAEVWITFPDSTLLKVPDQGYLNIVISEDIS